MDMIYNSKKQTIKKNNLDYIKKKEFNKLKHNNY